MIFRLSFKPLPSRRIGFAPPIRFRGARQCLANSLFQPLFRVGRAYQRDLMCSSLIRERSGEFGEHCSPPAQPRAHAGASVGGREGF
ncbi:MAG: hypothetical protein CGU28_13115 [Candidatus Dactylopiibacterium carminicum]|uniref:Uncharacterized protein n=1 Tax=Candidatus Dactylopiibacterium carminicum TaxID=857335 RepID=A0ABQ7HMA6_9RHOO|nr:hypothetical protein BGI27_14295 [Candidatus Dactylopiibacterium carminicum]PAS95006.1 MAG: hypothetical protein CGU28_13115 [Candidatus Dactylopiibacterium carminicum]PAS97152.1 MAG: hypothetical protein BSR46_14325 [Candidatus Dactylopiibacterium carminicum]